MISASPEGQSGMLSGLERLRRLNGMRLRAAFHLGPPSEVTKQPQSPSWLLASSFWLGSSPAAASPILRGPTLHTEEVTRRAVAA